MNTNRRNHAPPPKVPIKPHEGLPISPPPPTALDIIKQFRDSGLDAWDAIPDPDAYLQELRGCRQAEIDSLTAERDALTAENERLRKVLEFVEHGGRLTAGYECPCCGRIGKSTGIVHLNGCDLGRALNRPECSDA